MTGTVLVQAGDPAMLSVEIENSLDEHRLEDTFAESLDVLWLEKAFGMLSVPASTVMRKLVEMEQFPPVSAWSSTLAYMCQTGPGTSLAAELILEIGYLFQDSRIDPRKKSNAHLLAMKPNTTAFSIALSWPHIYERNGRREELRKLQRYINDAPQSKGCSIAAVLQCCFHAILKLGDLSSASKMVLEMLQKAKAARSSSAAASMVIDAIKNGGKSSCVLVPGQLQAMKNLEAYLEAGKTKDLAEFLIKVEREDFPVSSDDSMMVHVINSCIVLGWLDQAHDLLEEIVLAGFSVSSSLYSSLLKAYCHANRAGDVAALLRDARRAGIQLDSSSYQALLQSKVVQGDTQGALHLFKEMKVAKILKPAHQEFEKLVKGCEEGSEAKLMGKLLHEIEGRAKSRFWGS
ncbi:hypothetical protein F8388_024016 [Cannabis sativa]|uniref:Pentatricopeptide repeat-containing protein n=1 Tax=Cannabis sativa TaxID=3483 RepID=A0A7J6FXR8_CANSA|nr:hypothetical protein F8388_024016 [Cannabis sativa]